jgi:hypothetical protein
MRAFTSMVASLRTMQSQPMTLLPVFHTSPNFPGTPIAVSPTVHEETALMNAEASKVDAVESALISTVAAELEPAAPSSYSTRQTHRVTPPRRAYVDFTIGWDDVWPERHCLPSTHVKYTYNSYFNAYTVSTSQEPIFAPSNSGVSSGDDSDSEVDVLELASRSADEELLCAFHSVSISSTSRPSCPAFQPSPPAGMSPFCPPPLPTPSPPQQTTTWRLEWY